MGVEKSKRMLALDILRGLTVALMIVVNNGTRSSFGALRHSDWNGLTLCDMVFPTFLFIVGISTYFSLSKGDVRWSMPLALKVARRTIIILLIGWAIHLLGHIIDGDTFPYAYFRLTGVLPRIALCYAFCSMMALTFGRRTIIAITVLLLVAYGVILLIGNGLANDASSIITRFDRAVLGESHLYKRSPIDPEGLISTLGAFAHTLIGYCVGSILKNKQQPMHMRVLTLMVVGFSMLLAGLAIDGVMPINKRVWTPSFVLATCGYASLALGLLIYIIDIKGVARPFRFFQIYGVNPLFLYVLSEVLSEVIGALDLKYAIVGWIEGWMQHPQLAALTYSVAYSCLLGLIGYPLYKKKIYIKI